MEPIGTATIGQLTPSVLLLVVLLMLARVVIRGDFIPRKTHERELASKEAEIGRIQKVSDDWRAAHTISEKAREIITGNNRELIEIARTFELALRSDRGDHDAPTP